MSAALVFVVGGLACLFLASEALANARRPGADDVGAAVVTGFFVIAAGFMFVAAVVSTLEGL